MAHYGSQTPSRRVLKRLPTRMLASAVAEPLWESYMYKQSHIFDAFNKRYFILFPGYLVYYVREEEFRADHAQGHLAHRHGAIKLDELYLSKPDKKPRGAKYLFVLHTPHRANKRHEYLLVCQTRELRNHWMIKLQEQNPHLVTAHTPDTPDASRYRRGSSNVHQIHPLREQPSEMDEEELMESEDLSDHERHEPDEEEDSNGLLGSHHSNGGTSKH